MSLRLTGCLVAIVSSTVACAHDPTTAVHRHAAEGTSSVVLRIFPELPTSGADGPSRGGSVLPSANAAPCPQPSAPDPAWPALRAPTRSRTIGALTLRLPPTFTVRPYDEEFPANVEAIGSVIIGQWSDTTGGSERHPFTQTELAAWVGPEPGYPTVGADTAARQVTVAECVSDAPVPGTHVLTFALVSPRGRQEFLVAVWPVAPGRYIRIQASAARPEALLAVRRSLTTASTDPPRR